MGSVVTVDEEQCPMCLPGEPGRKSMAAHHRCRRFQGGGGERTRCSWSDEDCGSAEGRQRLFVVKGLAICPALCGSRACGRRSCTRRTSLLLFHTTQLSGEDSESDRSDRLRGNLPPPCRNQKCDGIGTDTALGFPQRRALTEMSSARSTNGRLPYLPALQQY